MQSSWIAKTERLTLFSTITAMIAALLLTSCSGFFPPADQIISLQLSPTSAWIKPTTTQQFSATATFGNNNTGDVTSQVTWQSSSPSIATIDSSGLATAVALGSTTITAKSNNSSVTATALMTVSDKTITGLTVNPNSTSISLSADQTAQFTASVTFSDGTMQDVTTTAAWTSSVPSVASISSTGLASPISEGTTTISASAAGVVGTAALTVTQ
ncbi:MAG TPA: Ig-like domain-containing protein [Verrucomicrobiae bacterium]|nr:Ig-like domain-containing protein [Verrucomicrobiae bacterium]